ncbi:hypothetical protein ADK60_23000, partial [Streptomyces sp. XY431]|uniref:hypothetical protein n=1 Tax=Streptomyces sp. XY431 TaxID=1415562 RepID=UPI0006C2D525
YSCAAILHRVLHRRPHIRYTASRTTTRDLQLNRPPQPITGWPADVWPHLPPVLLRALDPDPGKRHTSTGHFASALRLALTLTGAIT